MEESLLRFVMYVCLIAAIGFLELTSAEVVPKASSDWREALIRHQRCWTRCYENMNHLPEVKKVVVLGHMEGDDIAIPVSTT